MASRTPLPFDWAVAWLLSLLLQREWLGMPLEELRIVNSALGTLLGVGVLRWASREVGDA